MPVDLHPVTARPFTSKAVQDPTKVLVDELEHNLAADHELIRFTWPHLINIIAVHYGTGLLGFSSREMKTLALTQR